MRRVKRVVWTFLKEHVYFLPCGITMQCSACECSLHQAVAEAPRPTGSSGQAGTWCCGCMSACVHTELVKGCLRCRGWGEMGKVPILASRFGEFEVRAACRKPVVCAAQVLCFQLWSHKHGRVEPWFCPVFWGESCGWRLGCAPLWSAVHIQTMASLFLCGLFVLCPGR